MYEYCTIKHCANVKCPVNWLDLIGMIGVYGHLGNQAILRVNPMFKGDLKLESNPHALHLPKLGHSTDDGITRCGQYASRVARVTKYSSIVTCMSCIKLMTESELSMRRSEPELG